MAGETVITIMGNLTADPELRYTSSGMAVVNFRIAATSKQWDKNQNKMVDKDPLFMRCTAFREFAENVAESLCKGDRVIATGSLRQNSYENKEGQKVTTIELNVDEVGPSLRFAQTTIQKNARKGQNNHSEIAQNRNLNNDQPPF